MVFIYLVIIIVTLLVIQYITIFTYWKRRGIKGPTPLPLFGNTLESFLYDLRTVDLGRRQQYGPVYGIYIGTIPMMIVCDAEITKAITIKDAQNFTDVNVFRMNQKFFKDSFILKKGKQWKEGRSLVSPVFTSKRIKDIYSQIKKSTEPFFINVENRIKEGKQDEVDVKMYAKGYSLDVVAKFVFAFDLNSAKDNDHPFVYNAKNLTNFKMWKMALFNFLPRDLIHVLDLQILDANSVEYISDLVKALVKQRRENKDVRYNDFLDMLVNRIDENNLNVTMDEIVSHWCVETVSMSISNVLYCLSSHPEYQAKLFEELKEVYPDGEIDYDNLKDSKLLDAIICESQRLYPALNRINRVAEHPIEINGIKFSAGEKVAINVYSLHMDKEFWGDDVQQFRPERFLVEEGFKEKAENDAHFCPFGSGIRKCVAARMAWVQVKYLVAKSIMRYQVYISDKTKINYIKNPMALTYPQLNLGFNRRSDSNNN